MKLKVYPPLLKFADAIIHNSEFVFSNKSFINCEMFAAGAEEFKTAMRRDLNGGVLERALADFALVEAMNKPCFWRRGFAWVNTDDFATCLDELHLVIMRSQAQDTE